MLSLKSINNLSRHIAYIGDEDNEKIHDYIYFTELKESEEESDKYSKEKKEFEQDIKKYLKNDSDLNDIQLKSEYKFHLICSNNFIYLLRPGLMIRTAGLCFGRESR